MIENAERLIKDEFAKLGFDDVTVMGVDKYNQDAKAWMVRSNKKSDCRIEGDGKIHPAAVAVTISGVEELQGIDLLYGRAANAARTLRALIDERKPEEIPA